MGSLIRPSPEAPTGAQGVGRHETLNREKTMPNKLSRASGKDWMIYRDPLGQLHFVTESPATVHREGRVDVWLPEAAIEALIAEASAEDNQAAELLAAGDGKQQTMEELRYVGGLSQCCLEAICAYGYNPPKQVGETLRCSHCNRYLILLENGWQRNALGKDSNVEHEASG